MLVDAAQLPPHGRGGRHRSPSNVHPATSHRAREAAPDPRWVLCLDFLPFGFRVANHALEVPVARASPAAGEDLEGAVAPQVAQGDDLVANVEGVLAQVTLHQGRGYSHHLALQLVNCLLVLAEPVRRQNRCALLQLQSHLC